MSSHPKAVVSSTIDSSKEELGQLSSKVWECPEIGFKEYKAHELLTNFLEKEGFTVERSYTGIETAFRATFGTGRPNVCVICEYDALPGIGHACGHNLIAEGGIAAGLGLKAALESVATLKGRVTVMGTPAEETDGGKVNLISNGAFKDVDVAMMVHPCPRSIIAPVLLAFETIDITFAGKEAHAAAYPWEGVNALDAVVTSYNAISVLRQQMKPAWRVHGVILHGGIDPAIIPNIAKLKYYIRAPTKLELDVIKDKVIRCFEAAATATGCEVCITPVMPQFSEVVSNDSLAKSYAANAKNLGVEFQMKDEFPISTDMGNVSYTVPSIHPMYSIGSGEVNHTREFTAVSNTPEAHNATLTAAKAMAHTCIDVLTTDGLLEEIKKNFENESESSN